MDNKELRSNDQPSTNRARKRVSFTNWLRQVLVKKQTRERILVVTSFFAIVAILQINLVPANLDVKLGEPSPEDIHAPREVIDAERTQELQKEAADKAVREAENELEYQTIMTRAGTEAETLVIEVFNLIDRSRQDLEEQRAKGDLSRQNLEEAQGALMGVAEGFAEMPADDLKTLLLLPVEDYERIKKSVRQIFVTIETEEKIGWQNLDKLRSGLDRFILSYPLLPQDVKVVRSMVSSMLFVNLVKDEAKLRQLQDKVSKEVPPVKIKKGELIIREGDMITAEDIQLLRELALIDNQGNRVLIFFSLSMFSLFLIGIGLLYIYHFDKKLLKQERQLYLLALVILTVLAVAKGLSLSNVTALNYLIPLSFASIILTILLDPKTAWVMSTLLSFLVGIIVDFNLSYAIFYFVSGTASVYCMINITQRKELIQRGLILSGVNFLAVITLNLLFGNKNFLSMLGFAVTGAFNGILSTALANGFLPFLEHLFGMTSALSLVELANPNLPLLKRLLLEAPGTYHHSIIVGNLAEAAADAIGADSLLVRVGAYYHDVGKLRRPYFFIENQIAQDNPHSKLSPNLSTLIITSHVRDGVELAKSYGVPEMVIDLIEQHHGTDLVRYFYQRASEKIQEDKETLEESGFHYPGPKPQTKEAAVVMLADSVEAAARAMGNPSSARLEAMVSQVIKERLESGELDEANLTLRDLDKIRTSFLKVLGGIFHHRVQYPEIVKETERKKASGNNR
ncbi:MAG TPA: HDIG domain-containing protein [Firmicutes bacterium]|nr:HDIG domain-containing protein [Bacillota bacterium]